MSHVEDPVRSPTVSVVIPTFNRAGSIVEAINSVLDQAGPPLEVIVVDDASTDNTTFVVGELAAKDARVRLLTHSRNQGAQAARNSGIQVATGGWIAFLDADDIYLPGSIQTRIAAADLVGAEAVHSECLVDRGGGEQVPYGVPPIDGDIRSKVLARPGPLFPALLARAELFSKVDGLDERIRSFQEWDTAIRLSRFARFAFVSTPTFVYRVGRADAMSANWALGARGYGQVVRKHAKAIAQVGGPRLLAHHARELAVLWARADRRVRAWLAVVLALLLWPPGIGWTVRTARSLEAERKAAVGMPAASL